MIKPPKLNNNGDKIGVVSLLSSFFVCPIESIN